MKWRLTRRANFDDGELLVWPSGETFCFRVCSFIYKDRVKKETVAK